MSSVICNTCNSAITTTTYVKCFNCKSNYHFSSCCPLSESTYSSMYGERKANWKCQKCKPRSKSPNNVYQAFVFDDKNQQTTLRDDDIVENSEENRAKIHQDSLALNTVNSTLCSVQSDVNDLKSDIKDIKTNLEQLSAITNNSHTQIRDEITSALSTITTTLSKLVDQVKELVEKDKQKEHQINAIDTRINQIEQQFIVKNIEIKNVTNKEMSPYEIIKTIASSVDVEMSEADISNAYRLKRQSDKIVAEFTSLNKKRELMSKITRHRVDADIINNNRNENNNNNNHIYINDQLTFNNKRLLWTTKTKAREANWKYVWVRDGKIFARKIENSPAININNVYDIGSITPTTN